jgi:hypothetical protein
MTFFLIFYITTTVLFIIVETLCTIVALQRFRKEHSMEEVKKMSGAELMLAIIKCLFITFCPILNLISLIVMIINYNEVIDEMVSKTVR